MGEANWNPKKYNIIDVTVSDHYVTKAHWGWENEQTFGYTSPGWWIYLTDGYWIYQGQLAQWKHILLGC